MAEGLAKWRGMEGNFSPGTNHHRDTAVRAGSLAIFAGFHNSIRRNFLEIFQRNSSGHAHWTSKDLRFSHNTPLFLVFLLLFLSVPRERDAPKYDATRQLRGKNSQYPI